MKGKVIQYYFFLLFVLDLVPLMFSCKWCNLFESMAWSNLRLRILFALGFFVQLCFEDNTDVMFNINTSFEFIEVLVFSCTRKEPFFNLPPPFHNNISFYILCALHKITMKWKLFLIHDATASFDHYLTYKISYLVSFKYNMISFKNVIILNQEDQKFCFWKFRRLFLLSYQSALVTLHFVYLV